MPIYKSSRLQKLIWRIFPPLEVKVTENEILSLLKDAHLSVRFLVKDSAIRLCRDADRTINSIRLQHTKPNHLALIIINNAITRHLVTGRYHIYRGSLSMMGQELLILWKSTVINLEKSGYYSHKQVMDHLEWIDEQINMVG